MSKNIREIDGIDRTTARALESEGYDSPKSIANASVSDLINIGNIGVSNAPTIRNNAASYAKKQKVREASPETIIDDITSRGTSEFTGGRFDYKDNSMTASPFTVEADGLGPAAVEKIHESRPEREQTVDEKQNAPITTDEEKWIENKNRYDYPGVDTIPESRQRKRAEKAAKVAQEQGAADRVEQKGSAKTLQGKFSPDKNSTYGSGESVARVQNTANDPERTLAHELGHAFDYGSDGPENENDGPGGVLGSSKSRYGVSDMLFNSNEVDTDTIEEEAIGLSKRARGDFEGQEEYRRQHQELTADAISQSILEPRAARREAPNVFERVEEIAEQEGFAEAIPDPLGDDPEPLGFLD